MGRAKLKLSIGQRDPHRIPKIDDADSVPRRWQKGGTSSAKYEPMVERVYPRSVFSPTIEKPAMTSSQARQGFGSIEFVLARIA
jgi:hypothetical protein